MANLFPTQSMQMSDAKIGEGLQKEVTFGRSWRFDYTAGEFVLTPTGKIAECKGADAWLEWCKKALLTARYQFLAYSRNYGQEFADLIGGQRLTRSAYESEVKRMAVECLMIDRRTASVDKFTFDWRDDALFFTCEVANVHGETANLTGSVVIV